MAGFKNKINLSVDTASKIPKKYLGEPDDPHFIPASPLIERQHFTQQEEGELKRICALALAQIPHSDDMSDDPFKYIASQIQHTSAPAAAKPIALCLPKSTQARQIPPQPAPFVPDPVDTATPSENSKRDTFDRTDYSTPLTSAGITPGEPAKRFSDAVGRPSTSKGSSNLKYESSQKSKNRAASSSRVVTGKSADAGAKRTHDRKPSKESHAAKQHTIKLVQQTPRPSNAHAHSVEIVRPIRFSQLELNKKLPPLPRSETDPAEKPSINRFMQTIRKKKSQVIEGRSASTSVVASPAPAAVSKFNRSTNGASSHLPQSHPPAEQKQRRFTFSKFFGGRKESVTPLLVT